MTSAIDILVAATKASRKARGLTSVYEGERGPFEMAHPTEAHKAYYDLKYALRTEYGRTSAAPKHELARLDALRAAAFPTVR